MPDFSIISIGALATNPLWNERGPTRTGHATTVLIKADDTSIVVNPGLPPRAFTSRWSERTDTPIEKIDTVFLTSFDVEQRRALALFDGATWMMSEPEIEAAEAVLTERAEELAAHGDVELETALRSDRMLLERCRPAPDALAQGIDLFPLPGVTPGTCGLLLPLPRVTVLMTGDAIATADHLKKGQVLPVTWNLETALESFREAVEIADIIVPGRDNVVMNPLRPMG
jgi:glyoxylase-like metal-dependent hydrolase (beta-lactamase superfamily II)